MQNLFSTFDSSRKIILSNNWFELIFCFIFFRKYWLKYSQIIISLNILITFLLLEIKLVFSDSIDKRILSFIFSLFTLIITRNMFGLLPYIFTASRHLSFSLFLSIPLWLGSQLFGWIFNFNKMALHLVPIRTPSPLIPFLVLIERLRRVIRPLTLAIRLTANMTAGHLLLSLLGGNERVILPVIIFMVLVLLLLELGVAIIQAYVFTLLSSLYIEETIFED